MVKHAIVYRHLPDRPKRQYVHKLIGGYLPLWRTDRAVALAMPHKDAQALANKLWLRSQPRVRPDRSNEPTEPAGEYGIETMEVKPGND
jgi:hypothetical protein